MEPIFELDIRLDSNHSDTLNQQLYRQLSLAILSGRLKHNTLLLASRALARRLNVSRNTIVEVYLRLQSEGLIKATIGAGT